MSNRLIFMNKIVTIKKSSHIEISSKMNKPCLNKSATQVMPILANNKVASNEKSTLFRGWQIFVPVICVIHLNSANMPINCHIASMGALSYAVVEPRELFKASFLSNASSMILVHNHPCGVLRPSPDDTRMTDRLLQVAGLMGVQLLDHIIVGGNNQEYFSFRSQELLSYQSVKYTSDYHALSFDEVGLVAEEGWER